MAAVLNELGFQAQVLGVQVARHVRPVLTRFKAESIDDLTSAHLMALGEYMISKRGVVAEAMAEQGNAAGAKVYRGLPQAAAARPEVLAAIGSGGSTAAAPVKTPAPQPN